MTADVTAAVTVRAARLGDREVLAALWSEIAALHARLLPDFFRLAGESAAEEVARALDATGTDRALFVAELDGEVIGLAHAVLYDTPRSPSLTPRRRVHIEALSVAKQARRRGIGRRLMDEASAWGRSRGAEQVLLTVWAGNAAAEKFYAALGYRSVSRVLGRDL